jgi:hypothetical protein
MKMKSSTPWLLGAGAVALGLGFWYFSASKAKAQARPGLPQGHSPVPVGVPASVESDPTATITPDEAFAVYTLGMLTAARGIAILDLANMRNNTGGGMRRVPGSPSPAGGIREQVALINAITASANTVRNGGAFSGAEWNDMAAIIRPAVA